MIELDPENTSRYEINDYYLLNQHHPNHKYKLLPPKKMRNIFRIIDGKDIKESKSRIFETYNFFKEKFGR